MWLTLYKEYCVAVGESEDACFLYIPGICSASLLLFCLLCVKIRPYAPASK